MAIVINQKGMSARVELLIRESGNTNRKFALLVGVDPSGFDKKTKAISPWTINDVNRISDSLNVRKGWLLTGEGEMMKAPDELKQQAEKDMNDKPTRSYDAHVGVPYFNVDFELGFDLMVNDQTDTPSYMINFLPYNHCDAWCDARGNSMSPTISSGDIIALRRIEDFRFLISGEIYAICTVNGLRTIKRVKDNGQTLTLVPDNKEFPEQVIDKKDITHVFQVMGSMKKF